MACRWIGGRTAGLRLDLEAGGHLCGLAQHDARGTIFLVAHRNGALGGRLGHVARHREVHVDFGEDLGVCLGALCGEFDTAPRYRVATPLQDQHHVIGGAAPRAG